MPLRVVACDLDTGEEVVFAAGPLEPALLASTALPGLFPPIRHDGRVLVDGAVVDTVPLSHTLAGPVDRVYVLNIAGELLNRSLRSPIDVAIRAFAISRKQRFELELRSVPESVEVVVLSGPIDDREVTDFSDPERLIDAGAPSSPSDRSTTPSRQAEAAQPASPLVAPHRLIRSLAAAQDTCGTAARSLASTRSQAARPRRRITARECVQSIRLAWRAQSTKTDGATPRIKVIAAVTASTAPVHTSTR